MKKLVFLVITLMFPLLVFPQKPAPKPTPKVLSEKEQKLQSQKFQAISMVTKTAEEATFWEDKKTAVEALADAADLLWEENANQSAKWLTKAWNLIDQVSETPKDEKMREFFNRSDKSGLQATVLKIAHRHDAQLAENFLKQLTEKEPDEKKDKGAFDDKTARSEQLLTLALQAIETNPSLAFNLAGRSLADGISFSLQNVLTSLRQKDVNLANRLFDAALARLSTPDEAQILAGYLFKSGFTFATNSSGGMILAVNPNQQNLPAVANSEPNRAKNFLSASYQAFFARSVLLDTPESKRKAENILVLATTIFSQYNIYALELVQPTRTFLTQLQSQLYPNRQNQSSENKSRLSSLPKDATKEEVYDALVADLEEKADKETDPIAKKIAFIRAANSTKPEDYKRGISIAKKIEDENLQEDVVSFLLYRAALHFVNKKEIETAEEILPQIKEVLRRSVAKIAVAQALLQPKTDKKVEQFQLDLEKQRAFALLNDVQRDLRNEDVSLNLIKTLFGTTAVLSKFDKTQGLSSFEQTVQMINKLDKFNLKDTSAPKLGIDLSSSSSATVATPRIGFGFSNAIEPLIETDFEQVASIVERLAAKEVRGVGRIEAARLFFQKNKDLLSKLNQ
ncbi:MAG: hypothetical protein H0W58_11910 [Acidobacteria bacterium]|nr:hypothetical protein [Acidobacteriota bacterium]